MPHVILLVLIIVAIALIGYLIYVKYKKDKEKKEKDLKALNMLDQMGMRRAYVNTKYVERELFSCIESLVYSYYALTLQTLPRNNITQEVYNYYYSMIGRELEIGIKKQIYEFRRDKLKVIRQDNSSHYIVSCLEVEGAFFVNFDFIHPTIKRNTKKSFTQKFIFLNINDSWQLKSVSSEKDVKEETNDLK